MTWRLANSLVTLRSECNLVAPGRSKAADGTIGDSAHAARASRHNPNSQGVVTALDITHDPAHGMDTYSLFDWLRTHPHKDLAYVISNGRKASKVGGWQVKVYTGANPHKTHIHVAVGTGPDSAPAGPYDDRDSWQVAAWKGIGVTPPALDPRDSKAIRGILKSHKSPLPPQTLEAFKSLHSDFDLGGFLAMMQCESGMGTTGGSATHNNPANIKYRAGGTEIWHTLANGKWYCEGQGDYNTYATMYDGQRAAIRLFYDYPAGYNRMAAAHNWRGFSAVWYGANVPGFTEYAARIAQVHDQIIGEAKSYGASW